MGCNNSKPTDNNVHQPTQNSMAISDDNLPDSPKSLDENIRKGLLSSEKDSLSQRNMLVFGPSNSGKTLLPITFKLLKTEGDSADSFLSAEEKQHYTKAFIHETWRCISLLTALQQQSKDLKLPVQLKKLKNLSPHCAPSGKDELKALSAAVTSLLADKSTIDFLRKQAHSLPLGSCKFDSFEFYLQNFSKVVMEGKWTDVQPKDLLHFIPENQPKLTLVSIDNLNVNVIQAEDIYSETNFEDWKEQITSIDALIFIVPLSQYDHQQDPGFERLFHLYSLLASGRTMASIPWVVVFSKHDIFTQKLEHNFDSFTKTFPTFQKQSDNQVDDAIEFLKQRLLSLSHLNSKKVLFFPLNLHDLNDIKKFSSEVADFLPAYSVKREKQRRKKKEEKTLSQSEEKFKEGKTNQSEDEN